MKNEKILDVLLIFNILFFFLLFLPFSDIKFFVPVTVTGAISFYFSIICKNTKKGIWSVFFILSPFIAFKAMYILEMLTNTRKY